MALTKKAIDSFSYRGPGRDVRWDGTDGVPGFGVRVNRGGSKTYVIKYRLSGSRKTKLLSIGKHGTWTVQQARQRAKELLVGVDSSVDPKAPSMADEGTTLEEFGPVFLDHMRARDTKSIGEMQRRIYKWFAYHPEFSPHICTTCDKKQQQTLGDCNRKGCDGVTEPVHKPTLGSKDLKAITTPMVVKLHERIGKSGRVEANRVVKLLSQMFSKSEKLVEGMQGEPNPCKDVDRFKEKSRTRYFDVQELVRLRAALEDEPAWLSAMIRFYLASGLRKVELLSLPWSAIHLNSAEGAFLDVSATKNGRDLKLALTDDMVQILLSIPRTSERWVFPSPVNPERHLEDFRRHWRRVRSKADLSDGTIHDMRRTTGSLMAQAGVSLHAIAEVLNHSSTEVTKIYARLSRDSQREALETMSGVLDEAFGELQLEA
jgi:integrase